MSDDTNDLINDIVKDVNSSKHKEDFSVTLNTKLDIPRIKSGSISLDAATGGGFPLGRIVELFGNESNGKCICKDALVLTANYGLITVEELLNIRGFKPYCVNKIVPSVFGMINKNGKVENTSHITFNGRAQKDMVKIKTNLGSTHKMTQNHPLLVINDMGVFSWKKAIDINVGDYVIGRFGDHVFGSTHLSFEEAYSLGSLVADGYFGSDKMALSTADEYIKNIVVKFMKSIDDYEKEYKKKSDKAIICVFNKKQHDFVYSKYSITPGIAKDKKIPMLIRMADESTQRAFIQGFMDSEGWFLDKEIGIVSASYDLIHVLGLMLKNFGILSTIGKKNVKEYTDKDYWLIEIRGINIDRYIKQIGVRSPIRQEQLLKIKQHKDKGNINNIPWSVSKLFRSLYDSIDPEYRKLKYVRGIRTIYSSIKSHNKINVTRTVFKKALNEVKFIPGIENNLIFKLLNNLIKDDHLTFEKVIDKEMIERIPTFDLVMPNTHSFIAEGLINHNTTVAESVVGECQKAGGIAIYIDTEYSLTPKRAADFGINWEKLIRAQPNTVESVFTFIDTILHSIESHKTNKPILIVWDSVAATPSKAELEGSYDDQQPATKARAMSKGFAKIIGTLSNLNACLICINQERENVGVLFGSKKTTPGGKALKFHASLRLEVIKTGVFPNKDNPKGINVKVRVVKNKVAPPFKEANFNILFKAPGIDKYNDLIDYGKDNGLFGDSKGWYELNGKKMRRTELLLKLKHDPSLYEKLYQDALNGEIPEYEGREKEEDDDETETED